MDILFVVLMVSVVLWYIRHMNNRYQAKKFVYRMYELRDKLRLLAAKEIIRDDDMFHYFDKSICRVILEHPRINLYTLLYLYKKHRNEPIASKNFAILQKYCESHPELNQILIDYSKTILYYLKGQHKFSYAVVGSFLIVALRMIKIKQVIAEAIRGMWIYPETSESGSMNLRHIDKQLATHV